MSFLSAAFVSFAADTVSYRLSRIENWAFYGTANPTVQLVAVNGRGVDEKLDLKCRISDYIGKPLYELRQTGIVPQLDSLRMAFSFMCLAPGVYNAALESDGRIVKGVNMVYEPEKISSNEWGNCGLPELPVDSGSKFSIVKNKNLSGREKNVYDLRMISPDGETIEGYVAFPKGKKNLKGMISLVPEGDRGGNVLADFTASANMVELVLYMVERGSGEDCFRKLLAEVQLCIDFLGGRKEVLPDGIYVQGQGKTAPYALVASALDRRIAASFLSSPDFSSFAAQFDVPSILNNVKAPVLFGMGLQDDSRRLHEDFAIYNAIGTVKEYFIFPDSRSVDRSKWKYMRDTFIIRIQE